MGHGFASQQYGAAVSNVPQRSLNVGAMTNEAKSNRVPGSPVDIELPAAVPASVRAWLSRDCW
jgi:hypothetical protein